MQLKRSISIVLTLSLLLVALFGSALHEIAGVHRHCDAGASHGHSHGHSHVHLHGHGATDESTDEDDCRMTTSRDTDRSCEVAETCAEDGGNSPAVPGGCDDDCALCLVLGQSLHPVTPGVELASSQVWEWVSSLSPVFDVPASLRLASPRGPPVV